MTREQRTAMVLINNDFNKSDLTCDSIVKIIKEAIQYSQAYTHFVKYAGVLPLSYSIDRYIYDDPKKEFWSTDALNQINSQPTKEMSGLRGYSETSLKICVYSMRNGLHSSFVDHDLTNRLQGSFR